MKLIRGLFILLFLTPIVQAAPEQHVSAEEWANSTASQTSDGESAGPVEADTDPTKPVIFSMHSEYYTVCQKICGVTSLHSAQTR